MSHDSVAIAEREVVAVAKRRAVLGTMYLFMFHISAYMQ
jgi:hypothetical protein